MRGTFETSNSAFEDRGVEEYRVIFARIVREMEQIGATEGTIRDSNGNRIGDWSDVD